MNLKIPYVEIRNLNTLNIIGVIEGAEIFFEYAAHGAGAFEIYCRENTNSRNLLVKDNLVTLPNAVGENEDNVWIIEEIEKTNDEAGGRFIVAKGTEAKTLINRRVVHYTTVFKKGRFLTQVIADLLINNLITPLDEKRKVYNFAFTPENDIATNVIEETTQISWENLFDCTEALYLRYNVAAKLRIAKQLKRLNYTLYAGRDKRNQVIFSPANENLLSSEYKANYTNLKTSVIVGGEIAKDENGNETGARTVIEIPSTETGYARREVFIDARDLQSEYEDNIGEKRIMSTAEYNDALKERGLEKQIAEHSAQIEFKGEIDTTSTRFKFGRDFYLNDIVSIRNDYERKNVAVKVTKFVRVQNDEGYKEYFENEEVANVE